MDELKKDIALFRYRVISPLLALEPARGELKRAITRPSLMRHQHPLRGYIDVGYGTIEEWYYLFRKGGLESLAPLGRKDRGLPRKIDDEVVEALEDLARDRPELSGVDLGAELKARFGEERTPSLSSLYRALRARGLDDRAAPTRRDHRAFGFDLAGDCWQGDVMHGPALCGKDGRRRKTYLIAILDDATRLVALAPEEVAGYLAFRLEKAGPTGKLFLPDAVEALTKGSRGIPRLVDRVAETALLLAMEAKRKEIDAELVMDAVDEVNP